MRLTPDQLKGLLWAIANDLHAFELLYRLEPVLEDVARLTQDEDEESILGLLCEMYRNVQQEAMFNSTFLDLMEEAFPEGVNVDEVDQ